jgi:hypothetical protein
MSDEVELKSLKEEVSRSDLKVLQKQVNRAPKKTPPPKEHPDDRRFKLAIHFIKWFCALEYAIAYRFAT